MNSRIFIKNLPPYLKETELKSEFEKYGEITDVRILFRKNINRRIAYVGFKFNESALEVVKERNNTFLGTYKINISSAKLKDEIKVNNIKNDKIEVDKEAKLDKYKIFLEQMKIEPGKIIIENKNNEENKNEIKNNIKQEIDLNVDYRRLYITNLPYNTNKDEIRDIFEKYGEVTECKFPINYENNKPKGYAFISYKDENCAIKAFHSLDNTIVLGRILHIKPSFESKYEVINKNSVNEKSSYKKLKKIKLLEKLRDQSNWNSLFINPNLIINRIADKLNIPKRELLDKEIDDLPVKVSLAETEIINETKEYLKKIGVNMDLFNQNRLNCKRSHNSIIVKNLNYDITKIKLDTLFNSYGHVKKLFLADNKSIAIVIYHSDEHCLNAFENLQDYETYGTRLMLEYTPTNFFLEKEINNDIDLNKRENENENEIENDKENNTIYVKNINFETDENAIETLLNKENLFPKKIILVKKNNFSLGFGFIEFENNDDTQKCLKNIQNKILDNHSLKLSISKPKKNNNIKEFIENETPSNKILIKNIPFEATKEELRNLVKKYADIKSLRLPKKMDGTIRGFCFIELLNIEDAVLIKENLSKIHFYGRRLNIEFSEN